MKTSSPDIKTIINGDTATMYLYDVIGQDFFGGISAKMFADELGKVKSARQIDLHINSPGGSVFDGHSMFNLLKQHKAQKNVYIDGVAASIASVIAMAGDQIEIAPNGFFMVHEPSGGEFGTAEDHRKLADLLDKVRGTLVQAYVNRTNADEQTISDMIATETWLTAERSLELGFADRIGQEQAVAAWINPKLFNYKHVPEMFAKQPEKSEPEPEVLSFEASLRRQIRTLK
jgi:ATP-dependent Clp protease, protease subunit